MPPNDGLAQASTKCHTGDLASAVWLCFSEQLRAGLRLFFLLKMMIPYSFGLTFGFAFGLRFYFLFSITVSSTADMRHNLATIDMV